MNAHTPIGRLLTLYLGIIVTVSAGASPASTTASTDVETTDTVQQTPPYYVEAPADMSIKAIGIEQTKPAFHPRNLLLQGIFEGWTKVNVAIDENGKLLDALVIGYSHPDYQAPTLDALKKWKFTPAEINGKTISSVIQLNFHYNRDTGGVTVLPTTLMEYVDNLSAQNQPEENKFVRLDKLDRIPVPLHIISPAYSAENVRLHAGERVVVKFYIDETGKVRLPVLYYADNTTIARQALAAVAQWRFEPPTFKGKPVITRASQEFVFKAKDESTETE